VLLPIDRLAGQGLSDGEIASKLDIAKSRVQGCICMVVAFLENSESASAGSIRLSRGTAITAMTK
jgi:hypothetical protein